MPTPTRPARQLWRTAGFEAFTAGSFGNAGQNLYCSRAGVLQRIHLYDVNRDGHIDLLFCNAQIHWERPPSFVYHDVLGRCERCELPSAGAAAGAVGDLAGRGWDDLVLANEKSGEAGLRRDRYSARTSDVSFKSPRRFPLNRGLLGGRCAVN